MPEWFVQIGFATLLAVLGWLISRKLDGIDKKLDRFDERMGKADDRQTKIEKDCVPREEFDKLKAQVAHHSTEIAVIKTTCNSTHEKK